VTGTATASATAQTPMPMGTGTPTQTATPTQKTTLTQTPFPTPTGVVDPGKVIIVDYAFQPAELTVHVGEIVEWENTGVVDHTTTSNTGVWDSGPLAPNQKFQFQFTTVGNYPYHCSYHAEMAGTIIVVP